ncbi:hypothetical protein GCM10027290_49010 [Micromonospora sonneratiae]
MSVGYPRGRTGRLVTVSILGAVVVGLCCCLGGILGLLAGGGDNSALPPIFALGLATVAAVGLGLMIASIARVGAWLDGTRLTVRGLTSRTVDLQTARSVTLAATADSNTGIASDGGVVVTGGVTRTPVLTVVGPEATVRLRLRSREGVLIPASEMAALAGALSVAQCPGAREAASWLQAMASDPRTMLM